jgi:3-oxoacyl-[acyl-carrier-protein] synthase II
MARRVVVTGMGVLACNGKDVGSFWEALQAGRHGIGPITHIDVEKHKTKFGGQVSLSNVELANLIGDPKAARRKDRFVLLALVAAKEALAQAGMPVGADGKPAWVDPFRVATVVGSGIGGLQTIEDEMKVMAERGPHRVSPFLVPLSLIHI